MVLYGLYVTYVTYLGQDVPSKIAVGLSEKDLMICLQGVLTFSDVTEVSILPHEYHGLI